MGSGDAYPVTFQPRYYTRDNKPGGRPSDTADITNCHKAGDSAPHVVACVQNANDFGDDIAPALRTPQGSGSNSVVAFGQNVRDELQVRGGDGTISGALSAERGTHQQTFVAYGISNQPTPKVGIEVAPSLDAKESGGGRMECVAFETFGGSKRKDRPNGGFYARETDTVKPLDTSDLTPNCAQGGILPFGVRRLTPTECRRLQGFPDDWNDEQSDSAAYRQLGNAVEVDCAEWIGHRVMETLEAQ